MLMRGVFAILFVILLLSTVSSIRINEVESNPIGNDAASEWIELYSKENIDIERYKLVNNDGETKGLSGNFQGYYLIVFEKQWLDNVDEKIFLYEGDQLVGETPMLEDSENNEKTWQYCKDWKFLEQTKRRENNCGEDLEDEASEEDSEEDDGEDTTEENEEIIGDEGNIVELINENASEETEVKPLETIKLNAKTIKTQDNKSEQGNNYAFYGLIFFVILLGALFLLRRKKHKNEFR